MVSETTNTSTSSTAPANPDVNNTISALAKGISSEYSPGKSLYTAPGATTVAGQNASLDAASNPIYAGSVDSAIKSFGNTAAGSDFGTNDPGYAALRAHLADTTLTDINKRFGDSGLFGSDSNLRAAGEGLGTALAGLDYGNYQSDIQRQQQAASILPGLFTARQLPASVTQSVGASQDAATAAQVAGPTDFLAKLTALSNGQAGVSGQNQVNTSPGTPWYQTLAGLAIGGAGLAAR